MFENKDRNVLSLLKTHACICFTKHPMLPFYYVDLSQILFSFFSAGTLVGTLQAMDNDTIAPYYDISYAINGIGHSVFKLNIYWKKIYGFITHVHLYVEDAISYASCIYTGFVYKFIDSVSGLKMLNVCTPFPFCLMWCFDVLTLTYIPEDIPLCLLVLSRKYCHFSKNKDWISTNAQEILPSKQTIRCEAMSPRLMHKMNSAKELLCQYLEKNTITLFESLLFEKVLIFKW